VHAFWWSKSAIEESELFMEDSMALELEMLSFALDQEAILALVELSTDINPGSSAEELTRIEVLSR
jgi:hypothetical protein